jgi:sphingolipid delta-4 desaturase
MSENPGSVEEGNVAVRWHTHRHREILREHPEIKRLFDVDNKSALWVLLLGGAQFSIAIGLRRAPVWVLFGAILCVGAPLAHGLGVLIHECSHNLVFRVAWGNKALAILANLPLGAPGALEFRHQHLLHHRFLGDAREPDGGDTQAPTRAEVRAAGRSSLRKLLVFTFGRFFFRARPANKVPVDGWLIANVLACALALVAVLAFGGLRSVAYLLLSLLFAFGPHPLGARRLGEHASLHGGQPTSSYYGLANWISFDVGYHVEHHDFPHVAWSRLRRVRDAAPEHYVRLSSIRSWTRLILTQMFDSHRYLGEYVGFASPFREHRVAYAPREADREDRGAAGRLDKDGALVSTDYLEGDVEPQPEPSWVRPPTCATAERLEEYGHQRGRNRRPGVANGKKKVGAGSVDRDADGVGRRAVSKGIAH